MITRLESHCWLFSDFNVERGGIVQVGRSKRCDGRGHALQTHIIGYPIRSGPGQIAHPLPQQGLLAVPMAPNSRICAN
jgi:hypothetical protein